MKKILYLAANPRNTTRLRLDEEVREIEQGLKLSKERAQFEIKSAWAVRIRDIRRAILDYNPNILHFSGHGEGDEGLVFEDETGNSKLVDGEALAELCSLFSDRIECVILNACYSDRQARKVGQYINYVIGMDKAIGDEAAKEFSVGFYDGLGGGRDYEFSYKLGCSGINMAGIPEHLTPVLYKNPNPNISAPNSIFSIVLEYPEGSVPIDSQFYIHRSPIEDNCYREIVRSGALIRIKAPRQMGKTSLLSRILAHAETKNYHTAALSLQLIDHRFLSNLDRFLQWFCRRVSDALDLPDKIEEYWQEKLGSKDRCTNYFYRYLLSTLANPIVLGLDEVDIVFSYPDLATEFFGMLRAWHDSGRNNPKWQKLRLIITHSKEVYVPLNINQSPFNVGFPIELPEFNFAQIKDLTKRHGFVWNTVDIEALISFFGGHPFLTRLALYEIADRQIALPEFLEIAPTEQSCYSEHLRRHLSNLSDNPTLLSAFKRVIASQDPVQIESSEAFKLRSMGLVKYQGNKVIPACDLYRRYFCDRLEIN